MKSRYCASSEYDSSGHVRSCVRSVEQLNSLAKRYVPCRPDSWPSFGWVGLHVPDFPPKLRLCFQRSTMVHSCFVDEFSLTQSTHVCAACSERVCANKNSQALYTLTCLQNKEPNGGQLSSKRPAFSALTHHAVVLVSRRWDFRRYASCQCEIKKTDAAIGRNYKMDSV